MLFWLWYVPPVSLRLYGLTNHCCVPFGSFLVIKVMLGVNLVSYATRRRAGMEARAVADVVNDFGRDPIGEGKEEQVCPFVGRPYAAIELKPFSF